MLSFVVAEMLFRRYPEASEGELSRYRASLVSGEALAAIAAQLGLGEHLRLGDGEMKSGGQRRATILADGLEAVFGAIYLDQGLGAARRVAERLFHRLLAELPSAAELKDPKTRLQEWLQGRGQAPPTYACSRCPASPMTSVSACVARCQVSIWPPRPTAAAGGARSRKRHSESWRIPR